MSSLATPSPKSTLGESSYSKNGGYSGNINLVDLVIHGGYS